MKFQFFAAAICVTALRFLGSPSVEAAEVVAFWSFPDDYDLPESTKLNFAPNVDNTVGGGANLQAYLGVAEELDTNGGSGKLSYSSPTSGITYEPTRTLKWNDLKGGGDDFSIGGNNTFMVDKMDGAGPLSDDFGNDALMYLTFDGSGFQDFSFRFDVEGTPGDLPTSFDVFYRTTGPGGIWNRDGEGFNNISLTFQDYDPVDDENQFARTGLIQLPSALNNMSNIELIINDFAEFGNGELEIDNFEIIGNVTAVPEPSSLAILGLVGAVVIYRRRLSRHCGKANLKLSLSPTVSSEV